VRGWQCLGRFDFRIAQRSLPKLGQVFAGITDRAAIFDSAGHFLQHPGRDFIVSLLANGNRLRHFEPRRPKTVFERCNPHDEEAPELRLPPANVSSEFEIRAP
jgi:hypothetical protein